MTDSGAHPVTRDDLLSECRVEWFSGSGAGGQHRNKHMNSARVIHLPTGLRRECQGRKREGNLRDALAALAGDLERARVGRAASEANSIRSGQVGSGMRGDKRRTYRFQDDSVVDHVTGARARCRDLMSGKFSLMWK